MPVAMVHHVLGVDEWQARAAAHAARVRPWIEPRLQRRRARHKHPVDDFLFEYYSFSPAKLARWQPGFGVALEGPVEHLEALAGFTVDSQGLVFVSPGARERLARPAAAILRLLRATADRRAVLGCFALHEWAMVYRLQPDQIRHSGWPLRLSPQEIAGVVEQQGLRCTHFDAFRFFTEEARPRNPVRLTREAQVQWEQPGCLHATMDLYKWACRLWPVVGSDLVTDCFELARRGRELDMRAAPYDLSELGVVPIRVESPGGRREYVVEQRALIERGQLQRRTLIAAIEALWPESGQSP